MSAVVAGAEHSLYIKTNGTLWSMGRNQYGQLGDGTTTDRNSAVEIASDVSVVSGRAQNIPYSLRLMKAYGRWVVINMDN